MLYLFILIFGILGAGIKYIDDAFDDKIFNKKIALILAPFLGILWAYTMLINPVAATILLAVVIGVLFKGKIDNIAHLAGLLVIIAIIFIAGVQLMILPLVFLATAALLDEIGNDFIDKRKNKLDTNKFLHRFIVSFFDQRWVLKVAILFLCFIGVIPLVFFLAMVSFDYAYLSVRFYSKTKQKIRVPTVKISEKEICAT
ncbi:MAG: hypothetical protein QHH15_06325 [Candidatus Thermoplasmatota archaeon]|jgi:hypothetical protein|nr:hypothetical protein [Candidatus Thermoplasmatota archaeon]